MNIKEQLNFIALQEQVITILLKIKVLENALIEKGVFTAEEYNKKLTDAAESVAKDLKPVYEQLEKLTKTIEEGKKTQENKETVS